MTKTCKHNELEGKLEAEIVKCQELESRSTSLPVSDETSHTNEIEIMRKENDEKDETALSLNVPLSKRATHSGPVRYYAHQSSSKKHIFVIVRLDCRLPRIVSGLNN